MAFELTTKSLQPLFRPFNAEYLLHQRLEAPVLSPRASSCYTPLQDMESKVLLKNFLSTNDFPHEFERFSASLM